MALKKKIILTMSICLSFYLQPKSAIGRYDTPSRKTSKKLQQMLERKANQMLLKASQTLEHSTGFALGSRRSNAGSLFGEDFVPYGVISLFSPL